MPAQGEVSQDREMTKQDWTKPRQRKSAWNQLALASENGLVEVKAISYLSAHKPWRDWFSQSQSCS